jgi:A/G-specific adenine glycosylase
MELGQVICTARSPRCGECPIRHDCAWIAAGSPATEDTRRKQAKYEGSDRQARGAVMKQLRAAAPDPLPRAGILIDWHDQDQRERALVSLENDGLIEPDGELVGLPTR